MEPPAADNPFKSGRSLLRSPAINQADGFSTPTSGTPLARPLPEVEMEAESEGFTMVKNKKRHRTPPSAKQQEITKKRQLEYEIVANQADRFARMRSTLYIKGVDFDLVNAVKAATKAYENQVNQKCGEAGPITRAQWRLTGESIRLSALTKPQVDKISAITELNGHQVEISRPWCIDRIERADQRKNDESQQGDHLERTQKRGKLGIAFGLPLDIEAEEISQENGAQWARFFPVGQILLITVFLNQYTHQNAIYYYKPLS